MSQRLVGFGMHPRWGDGDGLAPFLEPLRAAGLEAVEFLLDTGDPYWRRFEPLMDACAARGFVLSFHAPYQPPHGLAGFDGSRRAEVVDGYAPMLDIAAHHGPATVVVHGACSATRPPAELLADTQSFLQWAVEQYPSLSFALENLGADPTRTKIGADEAEIVRIVRTLGHPRLGICWDMGHRSKRQAQWGASDAVQQLDAGLRQEWLRLVRHVHLHDVNEQGVDHYPLMYGRVHYRSWLPELVEAGFAGIATLEIKGTQLAGLGWPRIQQLLLDSVAAVAGCLDMEVAL